MCQSQENFWMEGWKDGRTEGKAIKNKDTQSHQNFTDS